MNLEISHNEVERKNIKTNIEKIKDSKFLESEIELANKLDAIQEFTIDRFEENIAILENRKTGEMQNIEKGKLPLNSKEGDILKCINQKYIKDIEQTKNVAERIKNKMDNLWD